MLNATVNSWSRFLDITGGGRYICSIASLITAQSKMNLQGKTAIVTGGTGALGSRVAEFLFAEGATIAIPYTSEKSLSFIPKSLSLEPGRLLTIRADLTNEMQVQYLVDEVVKKFHSLDIVVNTAGGYVGGKMIEETTVDEMQGILSLNFMSTFLVCRSALRVMRKQNSGRIVNIAAMPALTPTARKGPYAISKRAVITLTETIAEEVKGTGITVNAIAPSTIVTEANKQSMPKADFTKWVSPEEIARLVGYLCSDEARSASGNVIRIYGGV